MHIRKILAAAVGVMTVAAIIPATAAQADSAGIHVSDGKLYSAGKQFVPQGINHAYQWYPEQTNAISDIAKTGANTVRVVLSGGALRHRLGQRGEDHRQPVQAKQARLHPRRP